VGGAARSVDRALQLRDRRGYIALTATPLGPEASAGYRILKTKPLDVGVGAYAKTPWWKWDPVYGGRLELRF
jgi:hypothetical protein